MATICQWSLMELRMEPNNYYTALLQYNTIVIRSTIAAYPDIECKALCC